MPNLPSQEHHPSIQCFQSSSREQPLDTLSNRFGAKALAWAPVPSAFLQRWDSQEWAFDFWRSSGGSFGTRRKGIRRRGRSLSPVALFDRRSIDRWRARNPFLLKLFYLIKFYLREWEFIPNIACINSSNQWLQKMEFSNSEICLEQLVHYEKHSPSLGIV